MLKILLYGSARERKILEEALPPLMLHIYPNLKNPEMEVF